MRTRPRIIWLLLASGLAAIVLPPPLALAAPTRTELRRDGAPAVRGRSERPPGDRSTSVTRAGDLGSSTALTSPTLIRPDGPSSPTAETEEESLEPRWKRLEIPNPPSPRSQPAMVYEIDRQRALLFGGFLESRKFCSETWLFDGRRWERLAIPSPPADSGYMMAYDTHRGTAVLYGGRRRETWEFDGAEWKRLDYRDRPPITGYGAMAYDPNRRLTILLGGEAAPTRDSRLPGMSSETWQYDGHGWTKVEIEKAPSPRKYHQLVYDSARERFVLFGGYDGSRHRNDTWELRTTGWHRVETSAAPTARRGFAMAYDPIGRQTLLFGGYPGGSELWSFDGLQWTQRSITNEPPFREEAGMIFVPRTRRILLFGGLSTRLLNDTWELTCCPPKPHLQVPPPLPAARDIFGEQDVMPPVVGPMGPLIPPLPGPSSRETIKDTDQGTTEPMGADLRFEGVHISPRELNPNRVVSFAGFVRNPGEKDVTCRLEFWLSKTREPFNREHELCRPRLIEIPSGQTHDLSEILRMPNEGIPDGEYYVGLELHRVDGSPGEVEKSRLYVTETPYRCGPAR